jgi:hypothetical protein
VLLAFQSKCSKEKEETKNRDEERIYNGQVILKDLYLISWREIKN